MSDPVGTITDMSSIAPSDTIPGTPTDSGGDSLWVLHAPCGCSYGWAAYDIPGIGPLLTEDMVWDFSPNGEVYKARMRAKGFRWVLLMAEPKNYRTGDCTHGDPFEPDVWITLDGYTWAIAEMTDTVQHLVPVTDVDLVEFYEFGYTGARVAPLCGRDASSPWWRALRADPCLGCEEVARDSTTANVAET